MGTQTRRVGMLVGYAENDPETQARLMTAFRQALDKLGWKQGRSIRIGFVNYNRGPGCFMHSLGHGMESAMGQDVYTPMQKWFLPFAAFNLDTKYGLPFTSTYGPNCASGRPAPRRSSSIMSTTVATCCWAN